MSMLENKIGCFFSETRYLFIVTYLKKNNFIQKRCFFDVIYQYVVLLVVNNMYYEMLC